MLQVSAAGQEPEGVRKGLRSAGERRLPKPREHGARRGDLRERRLRDAAACQRADVEFNYSGPVNSKVVIPDSRKGMVPAGDILKSMIQIDRMEMNNQLDAWTETWNREVETGK